MIYSNDRTYKKNRRNIVEFGYVVILKDVSRDSFIKTCLGEEKVSVLTRNGELIHGCLVDKNALQNIEFPEDYKKVGSAVMIITDPVTNQAVVTAVLNRGDDSQGIRESEFKLNRFSENNSVSISGDGKNGDLFVKIDANTKGGIYIDVESADDSGKVSLTVNGDIRSYCTGDTEILSKGKTIVDSDDTIELGTENLEPAVLGDQWVTIMETFVDKIKSMIILTAVGQGTVDPAYQTVLETFKSDFSNALSQLNKLE